MSQQPRIFTLTEVASSIKKTLGERYGSAFWVKAEMNKLNLYSHSGHAYPELLEKQGDKVVAQFRSYMWKDDFSRIDREFRKRLNEPLRDGIKILFLAKISFEPAHGLSLQILDIDPDFTLGDLEREKAESIERLQKEGLFYQNKNLEMPLLPKRIAVISVETSKGYADFIRVLEDNPYGYKFFHHLFPSVLQGEKAVPGILSQLKIIEKIKEHFDVVALIRGGGGEVGLSCYNNYELSRAIATFPLPVISGIGHATNQTVSEMVSNQTGITPTKIAEFLIQKFRDFAQPLDYASQFLKEITGRTIKQERSELQAVARLFRSVSENAISGNRHQLDSVKSRLSQRTRYLIQNQNLSLERISSEMEKAAIRHLSEKNREISTIQTRLPLHISGHIQREKTTLEHLVQTVGHLDPANVLKRGFSITRYKGKSVSDASKIPDGAELETTFYKGKTQSTVKKKAK